MNSRTIAAIAIAVMLISCTVSVVYVIQDKGQDEEQHKVVEQFLDICEVPRCSGHNEKIGAYLMDFAASNGLHAEMDSVGNVMIEHPGTIDTKIILQAHQDMVPDVDDGVVHDFTTDPIEYFIEDGIIRAKGTTLGADDGTGIAICLCALTDPSLNDRGFKCIFTVDEETTMLGATNLDPAWLNDSSYLINIDDEQQNEIVIGSAGTSIVDSHTALTPSGSEECHLLSISGLTGGHSGTEIHKGRANAIILAAEFLKDVDGLKISSISGGTVFNAIPVSCSVIFSCSSSFNIDQYVRTFYDSAKARYASTDPDMTISLSSAGIKSVYDGSQSKTLIDCILDAPFGVLKTTAEGVITSSNTGVISTDKDAVEVTYMIRSALESDLDLYTQETIKVYTDAGASASVTTRMSGWIENGSTALIDKAKTVMSDIFGSPSTVTVIHAGLECGEIKSKCPPILAISIGPTVLNAHTTSECTEIDSIIGTWDAVRRMVYEGI